MIGLFKDREGKNPYDFGKGKDLITFTKVYQNGELKEIISPEVYLVAKGEYGDVVIGVEGNVLISVDNSKFDKELKLGDVKDKTFKIYFKVDKEPDFNLYLKAVEK